MNLFRSPLKIFIQDDAKLSSENGAYALFANIKINATLEINELEVSFQKLMTKT